MDLQEQPTGTGPRRNGSTPPLTATESACLRNATRCRGLRYMPAGGNFAGRHPDDAGLRQPWPACTVVALVDRGLLELICGGCIALPTDAAYQLLDGAA